MSFKLSQRSLDRLKGLDQDLIDVVQRAIDITEIDFGVSEGLRTLERQKELVEKEAKRLESTSDWKARILGIGIDDVL
mgnify:CR=1 FL=1